MLNGKNKKKYTNDMEDESGQKGGRASKDEQEFEDLNEEDESAFEIRDDES